MAHLGRGERCTGSLGIGDLADEDHICILAEAGAQGSGVPGRVSADLSLRHDRLRVCMQHLDRVLDGEDVTRASVVDSIDQGGDGGRLPGTGRARHQHQPLLLFGEPLHLRRKS